MADRITPDPTQLKALTHPLRLRMLVLLRTHGPATATTLADRLGINTGATSYHLRQLAEHGWIEEEAERGTGRDRWWRSTAPFTSVVEPTGADDGARDAHDAFWQAALTQQVRLLQAAVEARSALPEEWRAVSAADDVEVYATAEQAAEIRRRLGEITDYLLTLPGSPDPRPEGTRRLGVQLHTYVTPEDPAEGGS